MKLFGNKTGRDGRELIERADEADDEEQQRSLLDEAVRLADETGDDDLGYQARMRLTGWAAFNGDSEAEVASFGWCLGKHDSDPRRFPARLGDEDGPDLLWHYKWLGVILTYSPDFPLSRIAEVHADMSRRYREAGVGQSGVLHARFASAFVCGDLDAARELEAQLATTERDDYSHCEACVRSEQGWYLQSLGRDADALRVYDEIQEQDLVCGEEPEASESDSMLPLLRAGRLDDARATHLRSYRLVRHRRGMTRAVAQHLIFCAVTGNEARALAMLEEHLRAATYDPLDVYTSMRLFAAFGVVLDAVASAGHGDAPVRGSDDADLVEHLGPQGGGTWSVAQLAARCWTRAEELALRFDARNGNDFHSVTVARSRLLATERYDVPLGRTSFTSAVTPVLSEPVDGAGWRERSELQLIAGNWDSARASAVRGLDIVIGDDAMSAQLCSDGVVAALRTDRPESAGELLARRVGHLRASGRLDQAELEQRLGTLLFRDPDPDSEPQLRDELDRAVARGADEESIIDLSITLGDVLLAAERPADALPVLEDAAARARATDVDQALPAARLAVATARLGVHDFVGAGAVLDDLLAGPADPSVLEGALRYRAQLHGSAEEFDAGVTRADQLLALYTRAAHRPGILFAARLAASLLSDAGRHDEAVARQRVVVDQAALCESESLDEHRVMLGRLMLDADEPELALEVFDDVLHDSLERGAPDAEIAVVLFRRGEAADAVGDAGTAYQSWAGARRQAAAAGEPGIGASAALRLGLLLVVFQDEEAVEVLADGVALAEALEDDALLARLLQALGKARWQAGQLEWESDLDRAAHVAATAEDPWLVASIVETRAHGMAHVDRVDDAVRLFLQSADAYLAEGDDESMLRAEVLAARLLAESDRPAEAIAVYRPAVERLVPGTQEHSVLAEELAELLAQTGDVPAAEEVRRTVR